MWSEVEDDLIVHIHYQLKEIIIVMYLFKKVNKSLGRNEIKIKKKYFY